MAASPIKSSPTHLASHDVVMEEAPNTDAHRGSPLSHNTEDTYREKFENLKILVQQQQKELQSHKIRNEGISTITACLQEERQENAQLRSKMNKLEQSVTTLQGRLTATGHSPHSSLENGETVLPGPSKQLMDNLVRENTRLRQSLRQASGDPAQMEHLEKVCIRMHDNPLVMILMFTFSRIICLISFCTLRELCQHY